VVSAPLGCTSSRPRSAPPAVARIVLATKDTPRLESLVWPHAFQADGRRFAHGEAEASNARSRGSWRSPDEWWGSHLPRTNRTVEGVGVRLRVEARFVQRVGLLDKGRRVTQSPGAHSDSCLGSAATVSG